PKNPILDQSLGPPPRGSCFLPKPPRFLPSGRICFRVQTPPFCLPIGSVHQQHRSSPLRRPSASTQPVFLRPILQYFTRRVTMRAARRGDFMFCNVCGTMMNFSSGNQVECPLCKCSKRTKEVIGLEISYKVSAEDIRRDLGISHFEGKMEVKDMEMRSADEGQTTFFHCPVCSYTFTEN
ncbi:unnamed protein product, partial [Linum tenue]